MTFRTPDTCRVRLTEYGGAGSSLAEIAAEQTAEAAHETNPRLSLVVYVVER